MNSDIHLDNLSIPHLPTSRQTSLEAHNLMRQWIIEGTIPAGTILRQADIARRFGTSRTPIREAFRMLQEEGLIEADPNKRARVSGLDGEELDHLYGARIALEALAAKMTAGNLTPEETEEAHACLRSMTPELLEADPGEWARLHRRFHTICVARAGEPMMRVITSYSERSERYVRLYQMMHPNRPRADIEHERILQAIENGESVQAASLLARHLAQTAFTVLHDLPVGETGQATEAALEMVTGKRSRSIRS